MLRNILINWRIKLIDTFRIAINLKFNCKHLLTNNIVCLILLTLFPTVSINAQNSDNAKKTKLEWSGFFKYDAWYDSRRVVGAIDDLFFFYPKDSNLDGNGNDKNEQSQLNILAVTTRLNVKISGAEILGAKSESFVEADFSGTGSYSSIRFRHGYVKLNWEKASILLGRYWHPLFTPKVFPTVLALNTGAPFQPFNRSAQLTFSYKAGNFNFLASAIMQKDYLSDGANGKSSKYIRDAGIPNFHFQTMFETPSLILGVGVDYKELMPFTEDENTGQKIDDTFGSVSAMAFGSYKNGSLQIKTKVLVGQNLSEHLMVGGYILEPIEGQTEIVYDYSPINHLYWWGNIIYGKQVKIGLFGGYLTKLTSSDITFADDEIIAKFGRGHNIESVWRVAPHVLYRIKNFTVGLELDYTSVKYGTTTSYSTSVSEDYSIDNFRTLLRVMYLFN